MTGLRESAELSVVSPSPDRVRLSFLVSHAQMDVSLPLDVAIAGLVPALVALAETARPEPPEDPTARNAAHDVWVLSRADGDTGLPPNTTLREAGAADGDLLRLTAKRALTPPTLHDDVVDAAARLNRAGSAGWDATTARWMTFASVYLGSAVWVYFLVSDTFVANQAVLVGLSVVVALLLVGVATAAHRSHGQSDVGTALGWAALPVAAAVAWVTLSGLGGYGLAAGCAAMVVVAAAVFRATGTGQFGYLAAGVAFGLGGLALVAHTAGLGADVVGAMLAVIATLGCLAVPRLTARCARFTPARETDGEDAVVAEPFRSPQTPEPTRTGAAPPAAVEDVWARVRSATLTRAALYAGLSISAGLGALVVLPSPAPAHWPGLAFALCCAATLGLYSQRPATTVERAAMGIPAVALTISNCLCVQRAAPPIPLAAFGTLLAISIVFAVIGFNASLGRPRERVRTLLAYLTYLTTAALVPLALWAVGAYPRLGIT